jgi:hypothetical protein
MPNTEKTTAMRFGRRVDDRHPELNLLEAIGERACADVRALLKHGVLRSDGSIGEIPVDSRGYPRYLIGDYCNVHTIAELLNFFTDDGDFCMLQKIMGINMSADDVLRALGIERGENFGKQTEVSDE